MTAATSDRNTPRREKGLLFVAIAAATTVHNGLIACVNAAGYAVEGSTATDLIYLGRFEETVTNAGVDGEVSVRIRTDSAFQFQNSSTDPVTQASFGDFCFIEDNQTVAKTDGGGTRSKAGRVVGIDEHGVWVE
ncbi:hypothetical protein [Acinetobacter junii]|uniref:hypothetical protein n=1 Tax=Acinetobacter junii TaxID=40215 RepID=UPI00100ED294|nr:hypothetical protein [Acinetobacter junii]RXS92966.1 hypothetical protein ETZ13_14290 [Acinetobacter junii]